MCLHALLPDGHIEKFPPVLSPVSCQVSFAVDAL